MNEALERRLGAALDRLELILPRAAGPDWSAPAFRWRSRHLLGSTFGELEAVPRLADVTPDDLHHVDLQRAALLRNTEQFVRGLPANNVLLTGARGTGKSTLIRACLKRFAGEGLRMIEVDKADLTALPEIATLLHQRPERFIVFCDDLSFEEGEASYKALKAALDGSLSTGTTPLLVYATSNRRHLMPESMRDNLAATLDEDGELHPAERTEEQVSLSERFGLWLSFYPFRQEAYLDIVAHWLGRRGFDATAIAEARLPALRFALERGSRSGRVAEQFSRDWAGRAGLGLAYDLAEEAPGRPANRT